MKELSLGVTITLINNKPAMIIGKKIVNEQEIKIMSKLLMENEVLFVPIKIYDKLSFLAKLKEKKIV